MPQAFVLGDARINRNGRPPDLARQLTAADLAASRVARLMERPGSISRTAADLAARYAAGEDDLPFINTAGLRKFEGDALAAEIARRLVEKSRALLLLLGDKAGAEVADTLIADLEEGAMLDAGATAGVSGRRRKRRAGPVPKIHGDAWSEQIATAAAALDRLVGEEGPQ